MAMVFLPDGKLAVAGGRPGQEGDVRIYDLNGGTPKMENGVAILDGVNDKGVMVKQLLDTDDAVLCLALSPDGKKLAAGGCDRIVHVWDLSGGYANAKLEQIDREPRRLGARRRLRAGRQAPADRQPRQDGQGLGPGDQGIGADLPRSPERRSTAWRSRPTARLAYSVGEDNQLRSWNASRRRQAGPRVRRPRQGDRSRCCCIPSSRCWPPAAPTRRCAIWNADSGAAVRTLTGHTDYVYAVAISPDGDADRVGQLQRRGQGVEGRPTARSSRRSTRRRGCRRCRTDRRRRRKRTVSSTSQDRRADAAPLTLDRLRADPE